MSTRPPWLFGTLAERLVVILQGKLLGMFLISRRDDGEDPRELISG